MVYKEKELERLAEIRVLVNQLYLALNVEEHVARKEKDMVQRLEELKTEIEPLEKVSFFFNFICNCLFV